MCGQRLRCPQRLRRSPPAYRSSVQRRPWRQVTTIATPDSEKSERVTVMLLDIVIASRGAGRGAAARRRLGVNRTLVTPDRTIRESGLAIRQLDSSSEAARRARNVSLVSRTLHASRS